MYVDVGQRRVAEQVGQPAGADPAGAEVLVAVQPRAELRPRVVEVDHDQPLEPDPGVERVEEGVDGGRVGEVDAGAPGVGGVEAEADPLGRDAARRDARRRSPASSSTSCPRPPPLPAEFSRTSIGRARPAAVRIDRRRAPSATPVGRAARSRPRRPRPDASRCGR